MLCTGIGRVLLNERAGGIVVDGGLESIDPMRVAASSTYERYALNTMDMKRMLKGSYVANLDPPKRAEV